MEGGAKSSFRKSLGIWGICIDENLFRVQLKGNLDGIKEEALLKDKKHGPRSEQR